VVTSLIAETTLLWNPSHSNGNGVTGAASWWFPESPRLRVCESRAAAAEMAIQTASVRHLQIAIKLNNNSNRLPCARSVVLVVCF
jgi:hypothetical protein